MRSTDINDSDWMSLLMERILKGGNLMTPEFGPEMETPWSSMRPASTSRTH